MQVETPSELIRRSRSPWNLCWVARPLATQEVLRSVRRDSPRTRVVYDTIDLHFVRERREAEIRGDEAATARADDRERQELENIRQADCTVVVSENEAEILSAKEPSARAPLRCGAGVKGKINTAMAFGVPVVGTSVAVEEMPLHEQDLVVAPQEPQAFADAVVDIYGDSERWHRISRASREVLENRSRSL